MSGCRCIEITAEEDCFTTRRQSIERDVKPDDCGTYQHMLVWTRLEPAHWRRKNS